MRVSAPRWAVSFADLGLLLLGCFIYLHAVERIRLDASSTTASEIPSQQWAADTLFEQGEAVLTASGRDLLQREAERQPARLLIVSRGMGSGGTRLDGFELAAARAAAVSRVFAASRPDGAVSVRVDEGEGAAGQQLSLIPL